MPSGLGLNEGLGHDALIFETALVFAEAEEVTCAWRMLVWLGLRLADLADLADQWQEILAAEAIDCKRQGSALGRDATGVCGPALPVLKPDEGHGGRAAPN